MARSVVMAALAALSLVGCVGITQGTPAPTAQLTASIASPAPTVAQPTAAPTATPVVTPTAPPPTAPPATAPATAEASAPATDGPASPAPSTAVIQDFGADTLLFEDDFSDDTSGWGTGENDFGAVSYADGALHFETVSSPNSQWSLRLLGDTSWNVVRAEGQLLAASDGFIGLLCAASDADLFGAVVGTQGGVVFIRITDGVASLLDSDLTADLGVTAGTPTSLALDCAGTSTGEFRMQLSLPDVGLARTYTGTQGDEPLNFDRVGAYAESASEGFSADLDDVAAFGGTGDAMMSPEAAALLEHVPAAWRDSCFESPSSIFTTGALATVACPLTDGRSDFAEYTQYDTLDNLDAAFDDLVATWGTGDTAGSCETGPDLDGYTEGGAHAGRVQCAPQTAGIRVDWTQDASLILSTLTEFEGSYPDAYEDWLVAGPV